MRARLAVGLGLAGLALAGCADTVAVDEPEPTGKATTICDSILDDAPGSVAGQEAVRVAPPDAGRAWGSPAIILRCGVEAPADLEPTSRCDVVDGVGWFAQEAPERYVFTTIGRSAFVEVSVPKRYDPASDALADLSEVITEHDPVVDDCV